MNAMSPMVPLIPDSAPFTTAQRAWLNGFLAGIYGGAGTAARAPAPAPVEDFPWHDPALELDERLAMASQAPLPRKLMAAMAQLDCGQCGYLCQTYAEAIASGAESSLALCVPGARATQKALKALLAEAPAVAPKAAAVAAKPMGMPVRFAGAKRLTGAASAKDVRHIVLEGELSYEPGDSLSVAAPNDPALVAAIVALLGPAADVDALTHRLDIARPLDRTLDLLAGAATHAPHAKALRALADGDDGAQPADADLLDLLQAFPSARPPVQALLDSLPSLKPRLYSIASSPLACPGRVELCVGVVRDERRGRLREGIASTHLAHRATAEVPLLASIQVSHFRLPKDPATPVIMVGPGTGIAPFRAFLQHREALGLKGRTWLFFGDRHAATDFLFADEIATWSNSGVLSRLSLAWSRDGVAKDYVQHRMAEEAPDLWRWLQDGAQVYVCGDASRMAKDVDAALRAVALTEGGLSADQARDWMVALAKQGRYQRDVY